MADDDPLPVWGDQRRLRNWFHSKGGAKFLNTGTSWFNLVTPRGFALLTTTGRRTGTPRRSSIRVVTTGSKAIVVAIAGERTTWLLNLRADPHVMLRIGRRTQSGRARMLTDAAEAREARELYCEVLMWFDYVTWIVNQRGIPSATRIRALHERWFDMGVPLVIDLDVSEGHG